MLPQRPRSLIAPPLMHGTGMLSAYGALTGGGCVILLPQRQFSGEALWELAEQHKATSIVIVGLPFAQPMLEALDANPGRWDLSSVLVMGSSGAMWSRENKVGLIGHIPQIVLRDMFSSSEALGLGVSMMDARSEIQTAQFALGIDCAVFAEDGRRIEPGSRERGRVAVGGFLPVGYYKDEAKSAATFPEIEGRRWSIPGDWAEIAVDGTLTLLGRGSQCINTGGEKVFPEEVEEVLKRHPAVRDAAVTGIPDPRFGERIAALVDLTSGSTTDEAELIAHVKTALAHYKAPRHILVVDSVARAPNGKLDYKSIKARAVAAFCETAIAL
jgi:acyl-coenzyme A synthetase/AMP-(fatty) acid ligase